MLSQIVRPMVSTQIHLLANSKATRSTLVTTIAKWLGFLGVHAKVVNLDTTGERIRVSLTVGKPESCANTDWQKILQNLNGDCLKPAEESTLIPASIPPEPEITAKQSTLISASVSPEPEITAEESTLIPASIPPEHEIKFQRILAYVIQMGEPGEPTDWDVLYPQLKSLGLDESRLLGIKSALKVPQSIDRLVKNLDADVAAIALSQAATIAMLDRKVNHHEHQVMQTLLKAMSENC